MSVKVLVEGGLFAARCRSYNNHASKLTTVPHMEEPRAVIFDVDGTLVDSNDAHAKAWVDALEACGIPIPYSRVWPLIGMGAEKLLPELAGITITSPAGRKINHARGTFFESRYLWTIRPFPHVRTLVQRVIDSGYMPAVISNSNQDDLDFLLRLADVGDLLRVRILSDSTITARPLSDLMFAALQALHAPASGAIAIGDTPYDIAAAHRAGVSAIAFRCGGWKNDDLAGATAIYQDPAELLSRFDESVLCDRAFHRVG